MNESSLEPVAAALLASFDDAITLAPNQVPAGLDLNEADRVQQAIIAARRGRGETTVGYKIGFTNRTIWERYGVHHPIWAPMFDSTVTLLDSSAARLSLSRFVEPRLEPEIVVCLARTPEGTTVKDIAQAVEWIAHGFEIVQSAYAGWRFTGAQAHAAQGLHGALLVGPRYTPAQLGNPADLPAWLAALQLTLSETSRAQAVDHGVGSNVLDGPLHAIAHLAQALPATGGTLVAGDIITTGTITDAQPLLAGQRWQTELAGISPIAGLTLEVVA